MWQRRQQRHGEEHQSAPVQGSIAGDFNMPYADRLAIRHSLNDGGGRHHQHVGRMEGGCENLRQGVGAHTFMLRCRSICRNRRIISRLEKANGVESIR